jgi:hypothetical protein
VALERNRLQMARPGGVMNPTDASTLHPTRSPTPPAILPEFAPLPFHGSRIRRRFQLLSVTFRWPEFSRGASRSPAVGPRNAY